jgi:hypothetical protein
MLQEIEKLIKDSVVKELLAQKHKATGNLVNSVTVKALQERDKLYIIEEHLFYGGFVDRGRAAGKKGVPIDALKDWVMIKGMANDEKKARSIAWAIQTKIKQEGIPTIRSRRLAARRTGFIDYVLKDVDQRLNYLLVQYFGGEVDKEVEKLVKLISQ